MPAFTKLLVANRAEIAARVIRSARALGYSTVAVYSEPDAHGLAVSLADEAVCIGPADAAQSYLNIEAILAAAARTGADAIHPGYGFLAENADFARACAAADIVFVGPTPSAIEAMGDKAKAKQRMIAAGVPTVPGYQGECTQAALQAAADEIGYPVLLKASAGGGGRGMRRVNASEELPAAYESAQREARSAFGDATLIVEKLVEGARHVEVQVFADTQGTTLHLGERDCSAQRRHQKIIEESPCPAVNTELRARMGQAAVAAAQAIAYVGAGTVEFLLAEDGTFYFLEMNTRLQVEHPVTEAVTGLDLVAWQLDVAAGLPLPLTQAQVALTGHAIEARLYAEDPSAGFLPQTGEILAWRPASGPGVRVDHGLLDGVGRGQQVGSDYDPMIAKVVAHGATREQARRRLGLALRDTCLFGPTHNKAFLMALLQHPRFVAGGVTTDFVESDPSAIALTNAPALPVVEGGGDAASAPEFALLAAVLWLEHIRDPSHARPDFEPSWRSAHPQSSSLRLRLRRNGRETAIEITALPLRHDPSESPAWALTLKLDGQPTQTHTAQLLIHAGLRARFDCDGRQREAAFVWRGTGATQELHLELDAEVAVFTEHRPHEAPVDTSSDGRDGVIRAPTMGKVLTIDVAPGDEVDAGARLLTLEAMKIESAVLTPVAGVVLEVRAAVGDQVDNAQLLVTLTPDPKDPT